MNDTINDEQSTEDGGSVGKPAVMASAPLRYSGALSEWRDEDEDEDEDEDDRAPDYYMCMCCGHSQASGMIGMECPKCCGPLDSGHF